MSEEFVVHEEDEQPRRRKLAKWRIAAIAVGATGAMLFGGGVFAAWAPIGSMSSGSIGAATLTVAMIDANNTTFATGVSNLLPGDYLYRYVDVTNSGSVSQTFTGNITAAGVLGPAMTAQLDSCSVAWAANGTCSGTTTSVLAAAATAPSVAVSLPSLTAGSVNHLRVKFLLIPTAVQATYQGTSATQTLNLTGSAASGGNDRTAG